MAVGKTDVHIDGALTNMSIEFKPGTYVGESIFPTMRVKHDSDKYYVYSRGYHRDENVQWEQGSDRPRVEFALETESYSVKEYAPTDFVTDKARRNQDDPLSLDVDTVNFLTNQVLLAFEVDAATKACPATATDEYPTGGYVTLATTTCWSDLDNSDPISNIQAGIQWIAKNTGVFPTGMIVGQEAWMYLAQHPTFLDFVKRQKIGLLTADDVAGFFGFTEVRIGTAVYNSAAEGATVTPAFVWGDSCVIYAKPPGGTPGPKSMQAGVSFRVSQGGGGTRAVERWRDDEKKADFFSVVDSWDIQWTAQDASNKALGAYFIQNCVA